jgi:chemotaxis protein histidine kinase CheA
MQPTNLGNAEEFKQSFREEVREIVADLEAALLELNRAPADAELVGRVFRGLHTIMGSSSMFGFKSLAVFTHNLESAFNAARNGRLVVDSSLIDLTLGALDQMRTLLEDDLEGNDAAGSAVARIAILERLAELTGQAAPVPKLPAAAESSADAEADISVSGPVQLWKISFQPGPEFLLNGVGPLLLIGELSGLGKLQTIASMDKVAPLTGLHPERRYVSWEIKLETAASRDAIRSVFLLVEDVCALEIEPVGPIAAVPSASSERNSDAVVRGLLARVAGCYFVLPLAATLECIEVEAAEAQEDSGRGIVNVRGQRLPYIRLREYFGIDAPQLAMERIMILTTETGRCGFAVDEVLSDCHIVIRSLGRFHGDVQLVSSAAILGDGTVALVLDPQQIVQEVLKGTPPRA